MPKLRITLTLTATEADTLRDTLNIGADHRFAPGLQRDSAKIAQLVSKRIDAAILANGRARQRADLRNRASVTPAQRASNDQAFSDLAQTAADMLRKLRSDADET